ncbi:glycosyltransferase involved in cell wall biosynthesis [Saonia flava]|uniref:Glycosyltransferase involved in cell wall biosynthesis n=1 Tax=Saonia flava TaxID=523696 RepID=A0A846QRL4_9FLAO|nr:glycosyltransferase [Saonia flava]NJB69837.1 glycosyltransferase involved in cell wall biosynthesis [Saonia flava]
MHKKLLIIGFVWPEPNATAAGGRMLQLIHFFLEKRYAITFASTATDNINTIDFNALGIKKEGIQLNHVSFDAFIKELNPSHVLFDRFLTEEQFGWRVAKHAPNAIRILDTEDLHSLRAAREDCHKATVPFTLDHWIRHVVTKREIASIYRSDVSLIISSYEMDILKNVLRVPTTILHHLPFQLDKIETTKNGLSFEERTHFICIGTGKHSPNVDAFLWLKKDIWPRIHKELPKAKLHIYGSYLPQQITDLHNPAEGFYVLGRTADVEEVMGQARINLAPLRFGAGIKGKLADALVAGTPSVTTDIGAEGMHQNLPWNGAIENTVEGFAQAAVHLYQNQEKWQEAQENGVAIINQLYDKTVLNEGLSTKLKELEQNLEAHRTKNFTGAMLLHHSMASTEYMSRWIAEKNKG